MPLTLGDDFVAQHLSHGRILTKLLNIVSSMSTERKNAQMIPLHTTGPVKDKSYINSSSQTDQQAGVENSTPNSQQSSTETILHNKSAKTTESKIQQNSVGTSTPTSEQPSADTEIPVTKQNQIRKLVEEDNSRGDWKELRDGLLLALDKTSTAYSQLNNFWPNGTCVFSPYDVGYRGFLELATVLIEAGLEVDSADIFGRTMLHGSAEAGHIALAEYLLDHGADVNLPDFSGVTPLIYASSGANLAMVKFLVKRGANVNWADNTGYMSLHYAAERGMFEIVECLVEAGADTQAKVFEEKCYDTPMSLAIKGRHDKVFVYLGTFTD